MLRVDAIWEASRRTWALAACGVIIAAIAIADYFTSAYVSFGLLYLFPIMLAAGFLSRRAIIALSLICAALGEGFSALDPYGRASRLLFATLALSGSGLYVYELVRSRRLSRATDERLRVLIATSPAAILTVGESGLIESANEAAAEMLDPLAGNLVGQDVRSFVPELQDAVSSASGSHFRTSMQCELHRTNGEVLPAHVWFSTYTERGARKLAAIMADMSEDNPAAVEATSELALASEERAELNPRQTAVLRLVMNGLKNEEIAARLGVSLSVVKNTLQQLYSRTNSRNRSQLVRAALEHYQDLI